jgi:hypothetical protein
VSGCGTVVHNRTVGMIRGAGVSSGGGVVVMGTIGVTILHPREIGKLELPPLLEVMSPSSVIPREWYLVTMAHWEPFP